MKQTLWMPVCAALCLVGITAAVPTLRSYVSAVDAPSGDCPEIVVEMLTSTPNPDLHPVEQEISRITREKIGCSVSFREVDFSDHASQVQLASSGSNRMDIIFCGYTTTPSDLKSKGIIIGIGDLLSEHAPQLLSKCSRLMPGCYIEDDYYFVPGSLYPGRQNRLFYNVSLLAEYDIPTPTQGTDLKSWFEQVLKSDYPGWCTTLGDHFRIPFTAESPETFGSPNLLSYGVLMDLSGDDRIVNYYETAAFADLCRIIHSWQKAGYLDPDSLMTGANQMGDLMDRSALSAIIPGGIDSSSGIGSNDPDFDSLVLSDMFLTSDALAEKGLAVTSGSEHPEKCVELLNLIYTDQKLSNLMNYGMEGIHYEKIDQHIITHRALSESGTYGYHNQNVSYGDEALNYQYYPVTEQYYKELSHYRIEECTVSAAFGYIFDSQPVRAEVAAAEQVINRYRPGLLAGIADVDTFLPAFIRELKSAGIDDIIAENQRQFDAWQKQTDGQAALSLRTTGTRSSTSPAS